MTQRNSKQRLFEVMGRLDKTFKSKLNEDITSTGTYDSYKKIKNEFPGHAKSVNPIDSPQYKWYQRVLNFIQGNNNVYEKEELVKFFQNSFIGMDYDILQTPAEAVSWWLSPEQQEFIKGEMNAEGGNNELIDNSSDINEVKNDINPKYTHFAALKSNNKIVNGWDYNGIESDELKQFKKDYFFDDITQIGVDPREVAIYTKRTLEKRGVNPFDMNNWTDANNTPVINEGNRDGFKRLVVFSIYDLNDKYLGDLAPIDEQERASEFFQNTRSEVLATPEFQKLAQTKNITPSQVGMVRRDYEHTMDGVPLEIEYYAPSSSEELYDKKSDTWYNKSGQQMRDPSEYDRDDDGYTPFGDE